MSASQSSELRSQHPSARDKQRFVRAFLAVFLWAPGYAEAKAVRAAVDIAEKYAPPFPVLGRPAVLAQGLAWLGSPPLPEHVDPVRTPKRVQATVLVACRELCRAAPHPERYATLHLLEDLWKNRSPGTATLAIAS